MIGPWFRNVLGVLGNVWGCGLGLSTTCCARGSVILLAVMNPTGGGTMASSASGCGGVVRRVGVVGARGLAVGMVAVLLLASSALSAGSWSPTGPLSIARQAATATLLPDGKVLVAGGLDSMNHAQASAELYDPASGTWSATGSLSSARGAQTATLLSAGRCWSPAAKGRAAPRWRARSCMSRRPGRGARLGR